MQSSVREDAHKQMSSHRRIAIHPSRPPALESPSLPVVSSVLAMGDAHPSVCLPLGVMVVFTLRDDSVVFILIQPLDQAVLAAVQCAKEAGGVGTACCLEEPEELAVLLIGERCSRLLCLPAMGAGIEAQTQEHW